MDMQALRWVPAAGLFYHVWNLFDALRTLTGPHRMIPFLFGHPSLIESEQVRKLREHGLHRDLRYFWDGPSIPLSSQMFGRSLRKPPELLRYVDRRLLFRLWRRLHRHQNNNGASQPRESPAKGRGSLSGIDVFHHIELPLFPMDAFPANVMTIPDLTTLRVPNFHQEQNVELVSDIHAAAPRMDMLITESEHTKKDVMELLSVEPDRVMVTPLAAHSQFARVEDPARLQSILAKHGLSDRKYIINIGTLEPRKNHKRLIEAFHRLKSNGHLKHHWLVLVGGKGWLYDEIFSAINKYGLESEVKWLGYVPYEDMPALISGADVFAYPSLYEGFGLPPLEAMSCGAPVVASNTTSIPEVVGDAGVLVDPEDVDCIAAAIKDVVTHVELRDSLRCKSLARARTFTWDRTARLTLQAYKAAQARTRTRPAVPDVSIQSTKSRDSMRQWVFDELHAAYGH